MSMYEAAYPLSDDRYAARALSIEDRLKALELALSQQPVGADDNVLINGGFDVWQRGSSVTVTNSFGYTADRWQIYGYGTGASATLTRFAHGTGDAEPYGNTKYYANYSWNRGSDTANSLCLLQNILEDVRKLSGKTVTISFWANSNGGPNIGVELEQVFGTGGSPSASVSVPLGMITLDATPRRYVITTKLPSIVGKTIGSNEDGSLRLNLWASAGSSYAARASGVGFQAGTYYMNVWGVKLQEGAVATPFVNVPYQDTLRRCQRYFRRIAPVSNSAPIAIGTTWTANNIFFHLHFDEMRTVPAMTIGGAMSQYLILTTVNQAPTSLTPDAFSRTSASLLAVVPGSAPANGAASLRWAAGSTGYIDLSAEIPG